MNSSSTRNSDSAMRQLSDLTTRFDFDESVIKKYSAENRLPTTNSSRMTMMSLSSSMPGRYRSAAAYLCFFAGMSLLLSLGIWQLLRGMEKNAVERARANAAGDYITLERAPPNWRDLQYRRVQLRGDWLAPVFLLDNRMHRGQRGYEALAAFRLAGDRATLLINRGWIAHDAAPDATARAPDSAPAGELYLPEKGFTLGPAYLAQPGWPKVIQYFDAAALVAALAEEGAHADGDSLQPAVVALDAPHPAAFTPIRAARTLGAMRHFGYAAQWWGLAATLAVFGVIWRRRMKTGGGE